MTSVAMKNELLHHMNKLPLSKQCQVLQFARALEMTGNAGVPGSALSAFAGCIPPDELSAISKAVEEGCERVDAHEW
jgi:hypothetical protein